MLEKLEIGVITSTHGLKGEVNVFPMTDEPERFLDLERVLLEHPDGEREYTIESVRFFKGRPIIRFREVNTVEEAEKLRKVILAVRREDAIPLAEGEYFIGDLIGCTLYLEDGSRYGVLKNVLRTGANDVYEAQTADGKMTYIPVIPDCVLDLDPEHGRITVRIMREI